jgi:hypothetical protein
MSRILRNLLLLALIIAGGGNLFAQTKWVKSDLADLTSVDQVVIVDLNSNTAMTNNNGTKKAPTATAVTLSTDGSELTSTVADNLKWKVNKSGGEYKFHPYGTSDSSLYCTNANNGVRVGTNTNNTFTIYSKGNYVGLYNVGTKRYIGVYNKQDWRCYNSTTTNISTTHIAYFKLTSSEPGKTITSLSFGDNADKTFWKDDTEGTTFTQTATLTPAVEGAKITYSSSNENVAVVDANSGEVVVSTDKAATATITATYAGDDAHAGSTATYTITVEPLCQNLAELKAAYSKSPITEAVRLTDAQVTYVNGNKHYLQDASGAVCVFLSDFNYVAGDKLNGIANVTYTLYNGLPEIQSFAPIGEITKTSGDAPAPETMTITDALKDENLCKYVIIKNVNITPGSKGNATAKDKDGNSIAVYKNGTTFVAGDYDLTGVNSIHSTKTTTTKQIAFISYAPDFTIDESADANAITAGENGTVTIGRTFNANAWNTLVLPFDVSANDLPDKFGHDAKFATYTGTSKNNDGTYTLNFQSTSALTANTPVFVWGANDEGVYQFSGVKVVKADPTSTPSDAAFSFTGSYDKTTLKPGDWFISSDNKFYRALGTETMKPMRAVFRPVSDAAAKGLSFSIDGGEATGISAITTDGSIIVNDKAPMYNLAGQRVSKSYKGVVIQNGKKYIK